MYCGYCYSIIIDAKGGVVVVMEKGTAVKDQTPKETWELPTMRLLLLDEGTNGGTANSPEASGGGWS
jgi:hypothetical protein